MLEELQREFVVMTNRAVSRDVGSSLLHSVLWSVIYSVQLFMQ